MTVTMNGEVRLAATPGIVWEKLNDPEVLKVCIPGCNSLSKVSDAEFHGLAILRIGPITVKFRGKSKLSHLDPPCRYEIFGNCDGGVAGFAKGGAIITLAAENGGTLLGYSVTAEVGGMLAQHRQCLVRGTANKVVSYFFERFANECRDCSRVGNSYLSEIFVS
jgi:uncharacterized protein